MRKNRLQSYDDASRCCACELDHFWKSWKIVNNDQVRGFVKFKEVFTYFLPWVRWQWSGHHWFFWWCRNCSQWGHCLMNTLISFKAPGHHMEDFTVRRHLLIPWCPWRIFSRVSFLSCLKLWFCFQTGVNHYGSSACHSFASKLLIHL